MKADEGVHETMSEQPMSDQPITVPKLQAMKAEGRKITVVTAYDYLTGKLVDEAGIDCVLVGDSLGMVVLGYDSTLPVTMDEMLHHTKAVRRGVKRALLVGDMPFGSFQGSVSEAVANATRFLKEAGADAVKLEGGEPVAESVARMVEVGIPVMGHLGMTPQSVRQFGGFKVQGRQEAQRRAILAGAKALEQAGAFSIVLEGMPVDVAAEVTASVSIPTIGIGAGRACDGQVLVLHDLLGLFDDFKPKFVKRFANLAQDVRGAVAAYCDEVRRGEYPQDEFTYR